MNNYPDYRMEKLQTFYDLFCRLSRFGDSPAFINKDETITYAKFVSDVDKVAAAFAEKNRFVLVNCEDKYLYVTAFFAAVLSGNIACLQPCLPAPMPCFQGFDLLCTVGDEFVLNALSGEGKGFEPPADKNRICTVLCSSGTTATPKAIALTEWNMIGDFLAGMEKYEYADGGRYVNIVPYSHAFGITCDLMGPLYSRSCVCFTYSMAEFFGKLPEIEPTALCVIPALVDVLAKQMEVTGGKERIVGKSLKKILSGGAGTPAELCRRMEKFGILVCGCYGLTEGGPCISVNRDRYYKYGSAGVILNCNEVIVKETGELAIRGTNVMAGYLDERGALIPTKDRTFETGDLGYIDEDGFLFVVGRADDLMVFSDGTKLMPTTVETEICKLDEVLECVVFKKGDRLACVACVTTETAVEETKKKLLTMTFGGYRLSAVECSTEPLVKNALGKIKRKQYSAKE